MKHTVQLYTLDKKHIASGQITIEEDGNTTVLSYTDPDITVSAIGVQNPFTALISLREKLETFHHSILAINGCRIDTAYMSTSNQGTYIIKNGKPSTRSINMFEPTSEIDKLCTIDEHEVAYNQWLENIMTL